jgi:hypothetical protein
MFAVTADPAVARRVRQVFCLITLSCIGLGLYPLVCPELVQDDFQILSRGATWQRTVDAFWVPQNEHTMPLGRLLTWALMRLGGQAPVLPWTAGLVGPVALLGALPLVYLFVRRELGHPLYGLVAAALFGVSSVYQQAVYWFAAAFSILALDTILLALLAAQRWRQTGRGLWLDLATLLCFLAPGWFASGVLAGPLCVLYVSWPRRTGEDSSPYAPGGTVVRRSLPGRFERMTFVPLLGTVLFLAVSLPQAAPHLQRLEHHGGRSLVEAVDLQTGLVYSLRSVVDNLLLGIGGVSTVVVPRAGVVVVLALAVAAASWWWRRAPEGRLLLLGLGMIGSAYLLAYSARAAWAYEAMTNWSRYHLLPQLGLALFVAGGLPAWQGRRLDLRPDGLTRRQARALALLVAVLFIVQLPRALLGYFVPLPGIERLARNDDERSRLVEARQTRAEQRVVLRQIADAEERLRAQGVDPAAASVMLPRLAVPGADVTHVNGWELLRGHGGPCPLAPEEVRRLVKGSE